MSQSLVPCPSCARHLRAGGATCPFCDAALPAGFGASARAIGPRGRPASRAAMLFAAAALAASCGGTTESTTSGSSDAGRDAAREGAAGDDTDAEGVTLYGPGPVNIDAGPGVDAGRADASSQDAATEDAPNQGFDGSAVLYGPAPVNDGGH
ncbi:MAG TPA: hypothetical protein VGL81_25350 [Polyangiaceae bacterium]|jgi:hypothetical protein